MLTRTSLFSAFVVLLLTSPALSDAITIPNGSFEGPFVANLPPYASANISIWQKSPPPASWTYGATQWYNGAGTFVNVAYDWIDNLTPTGGTSVHQQASFMFSSPGLEISQQLTDTFQVGTSYQLTVGIQGGGYGMVLGCPMQIGLYYLDGGGNQVMVGTTTVLNDNPSPTGDITHLPDRQLSIPAVAAGSPWAGQNIGVALLQTATPANAGGYWDIDNVRLVATITPTAVWTGAAVGNLNWSASGNWAGKAPASGTSLIFANTGGGHTSNSNDFSAGTPFAGITFAAGSPAFNLQGNAIQLSGPVVNQSSVNQSITLAMQVVAGGGTFDSGAGSTTIAGAISGLSLTKLGTGTLILSGSNSYTDGTSVLEGTLQIASASALPAGEAMTIGDGARLVFDSAASMSSEAAGSWVDVSGGHPAQAITFGSEPQTVPEPGTLALLAVCAAATAGAIGLRPRHS